MRQDKNITTNKREPNENLIRSQTDAQRRIQLNIFKNYLVI